MPSKVSWLSLKRWSSGRKSRKKPFNVDVTVEIEKKTAIYIRLSREDYSKKGDSLENQKHIAMEYLLTIPELGIPVIYEDNGFTGRNTQRPAFQQMIQDIENGLIEAVIVKDLSRISRNSIDSGYYLDKFFPLHGIRFIAVTDCYDSALDKDGTEGAILPIKNMLNEAHSLDLSKKIKSVKQKSMRDGEYVGGVPPYGYRKSEDSHFKLEIDETASKVVLELFERTLNGEKIGSIARIFNDRLELSPLDYYDASRGKPIKPETARCWGNHTIEKILTSEVYIGHITQGRFENQDGICKKTDESKWIKTENTHEPLISEEIFQKVQVLVAQNKKTMERKKHKPNIYVNRLFCGHCGKPMSRCTLHRQDGTYFKYKCKSNYLVRKDYCSKGFENIIWEDDLNKKIADAIDTQFFLQFGKTIESYTQKFLLMQKEADDKNILKNLEAEISKQQVHLKSLYENLVKGILTKQDYTELKQSYEDGIHHKKLQYNMISGGLLEIEQKLLALHDLGNFKEVGSMEMTVDILNAFVERIDVSMGEEVMVEITFKFNDIFVDEGDNHEST